jgi:hypothetical protein
MNGVMANVTKKVVNRPTDVSKMKKEMAKHVTETMPPIKNIHPGSLTAVLTDTNLSKTIIKNLF